MERTAGTIYRCQSAYKLVELNEQFRLFSRFHPRTVVDLAAAPGGFAQVALELMHQAKPPTPTLRVLPPLVIAVDQRPIDPLPGLVAVRGNILQHQQILQTVQQTLHRADTRTGPARTVDMVLHDGVSVVKGQHAFSVTYAQNQMALSTLLLASKLFLRFGPQSRSSTKAKEKRHEHEKTGADHRTPASPSATTTSKVGGVLSPSMRLTSSSALPVCFVSKVQRSPHFSQVMAATNALFRHVAVFKPEASRAESQETYVVATHFLPHHWQLLLKASRHSQYTEAVGDELKSKTKPKRSSFKISPALFSMPPARDDCSDTHHMVWSCLGCGRTCVGVQPCAQCGAFVPARCADL